MKTLDLQQVLQFQGSVVTSLGKVKGIGEGMQGPQGHSLQHILCEGSVFHRVAV